MPEIPTDIINRMPRQAATLFEKWRDFMRSQVKFNRPDSSIHAEGHCERVLYHALDIASAEMPGDTEALEILAQASVFHDSRRMDDYLDTGHGARAAVYYEDFCREHPEAITYHPEVSYIMRYHDMPDTRGIDAISRHFGADARKVIKLYDIFKDADALDRWRLGSLGLDPRFLRTGQARQRVKSAKELVRLTVDADQLRNTDMMVRESLRRQGLLPSEEKHQS